MELRDTIHVRDTTHIPPNNIIVYNYMVYVWSLNVPHFIISTINTTGRTL